MPKAPSLKCSHVPGSIVRSGTGNGSHHRLPVHSSLLRPCWTGIGSPWAFRKWHLVIHIRWWLVSVVIVKYGSHYFLREAGRLWILFHFVAVFDRYETFEFCQLLTNYVKTAFGIVLIFLVAGATFFCLQRFDAVGWAAGRASGL